MALSRRWSLATGLALALLGTTGLCPSAAAAPQRGKDKKAKLERVPYFEGRLEEAQKQALERNVPVVILAVLEGEEASDRFRDQLLDNRTLAAGTGGAIVVLVNNGTHETVKLKTKGADGKTQTIEVCAAFHTASCEVHQRNWDGAYQEYVAALSEDGAWQLPTAYVISPQNELKKTLYDGQPPADSAILAALRDAQRAAGPGITLAQLRNVQKLTEDGRLMIRATGWPDAYRAYSAVLEIVATGKYGEEAQRESKVALQAMRKDLDAALALIRPDSIREGYTQLAAMSKSYAGSPLEKDVTDGLKAAARNKDLKAVVAMLKLEFAADELWDEALVLVRAGKRKEANRLLKKILSKRYAETPAAERVRKEFPELVK